MQKPPTQNGVAEVKPRLTKEQHDILEAEFQRHHKPSTATKKGFADHLGVPLDKINNWFQNRRAKVKQEAKKAQNAQMMQASLPFHHLQHHPVQHVSHVPQPPVTDFYQLNNSFAAAPLPPDALDVPQCIEDTLQPFSSQHPDYNALFLTSISESTQPATKESVIQSMIKAGYGWDPMTMPDLTGHQFPGSQFGLSLDVPNAAGPVGDVVAGQLPQGFEYTEETTHNGVSPSNSTSSGPSTFSVATTAATAMTTNPMASSSNLSFSWTDNQGSTDVTPAKQMENPFEADLSNFPTSNHHASSSQVSLPQWMGSASYQQPSMYLSSNNSSQVVLSTTEQIEPGHFGELEPPMPPFAEGTYSRRSSSTSVLVENMKTVGIQNGSATDLTNPSGTNGGFQPSVPTSGLAARRQRHPAPLNQSMRSASFTSGMNSMPSPGATQTLTADHTLRRIRSTGLTNGRIQKPGSASAQRSPLHFTFEQAANSPKFARQVAGYATAVSTPGLPVSSGSLAPLTPCTPSDGGRFPQWQPSSIAKSQPPQVESNSPPDSLGIQWPSEPSSEDAFPVNSPPRTPLEANQLNQLRQNNPVYRDTPPQSAPATQACFSRPVFAPTATHSQDFLAPNDYNTSLARQQQQQQHQHQQHQQQQQQQQQNHLRRPSLPVSNPATGYPVDNMPMTYAPPQMTTATADASVYGMQFGNPMMNGYAGDSLGMFPQDSHAMSSVVAPGQPMAGASDLFVHQYSPPQATDPKGTASPRRNAEPQVKNYVFANQGPHDFQGSS